MKVIKVVITLKNSVSVVMNINTDDLELVESYCDGKGWMIRTSEELTVTSRGQIENMLSKIDTPDCCKDKCNNQQ